MEKARVALFEDHPAMLQGIPEWLLLLSNHRVVLKAGSLPEALEVIEQADPDSIDVALVDADLGVDHSEGAEVVKKLRQKMGDMAIIGISAGREDIVGATTNIFKGRIEKIIEYIDDL